MSWLIILSEVREKRLSLGQLSVHQKYYENNFNFPIPCTALKIFDFQVARDINSVTAQSPTIDLLADCLPPVCLLAQCFVCSSIILHTDSLMFYEEFSWFLLFVINTGLNAVFLFYGT